MSKISIITATYNSQKTIKDTLFSVKMQNYSNIEHILIDGKSSDKTLDLIKKYSLGSSKIISERDDGLYDALNKGMKLASGDIIGFLHSDDIFANDKVLSNIANIFKKQNVDAVYGDLEYVAVDNFSSVIRYWKSKQFELQLLNKGWMPPHPTFFMKTYHYKKLGYFDCKYKISADYDALLRYLTQKDFRAHYLPSVITKMRVGGASNKNIKNILIKLCEDFSIIKKHGLPPIAALLGKNFSKLPQFFH